MMVLMDSPYHSCQAVMIAREFMIGHSKIVDNPFLWSEAVINLPVYQG